MEKRSRGGYVVVLVTCGTRREAARIAQTIVEQRVAACVNIVDVPVRSVYRWKGKVEKSREFLLIIKSARRRLRALRLEVERLHRYKVPEFLVLPVLAGARGYLAWLDDCVRAR